MEKQEWKRKSSFSTWLFEFCRAEDWNLSKPLKTCSLLVERRADTLAFDFNHDGQLFAHGVVDLIGSGQPMQHFVEQVVDSSRYFVLKIQGEGGREATIGFGFRERDQATDLRETLQHYEKAVRRENSTEASSSIASFSVPAMAEGEKIHVDLGGKTTSVVKAEGGGSGGGDVPLLRKPPPPSEDAKVAQMSIQMGDIDLDARPAGGDDDDEDDSGGAVYEGDEEQWATEFAMK